MAELGLQLGLADEDDLEELAGVGFQIGEEADVLKGIEGHILGFIDDEDDLAALFDEFEQVLVELFEQFLTGPARFGDAEFAEDTLEQLGIGEARIEDEGGFDGLGFELGEELSTKGGFAATDFAGEHDEALAFADAVAQVFDGLLVTGGEIEEARVGGYVERAAVQPEEALIHG